ncbi:hypothetical protein [Sphingobacterium sp.]|uniref:hypothetical protein n=1 Tax=Sphingobacterium sp. TaxID=341027 RepID=UPI00289B0D61|nr:hypothetical protein [Sphingobacterium sp.]
MGFRLGAKEVRALQLPQDADKIERLLTTVSGYRIFHNPIYILFLAYDRVVATITDGSRPGWSSLVTKDGPLAQRM